MHITIFALRILPESIPCIEREQADDTTNKDYHNTTTDNDDEWKSHDMTKSIFLGKRYCIDLFPLLDLFRMELSRTSIIIRWLIDWNNVFLV